MSTTKLSPSAPPRRVDHTERFMGFAFAAAELLVETDAEGRIVFATGAFRSVLGQTAEACIGNPVHALVAPGDHAAIDHALAMLATRGRLPPVLVRMADAGRSFRAMGGLVLAEGVHPKRICLSFATPPAPAAAAQPARSLEEFGRRTEELLRGGEPCDLQLLEVTGADGAPPRPGLLDGLQEGLAEGFAGEISPGRFGLVGASTADFAAIASMLERTLCAEGAKVVTQEMSLPERDLSPVQAARALRQALGVFAREGAAGLTEAGFAGGLASYIAKAGAQTSLLRRAIRAGQFAMVFQPIVTLAGRQVHHYEALIRPNPIEGCTFAGVQAFVQQVEALGLADELDLAVAANAAEAAGRSGLPVAFNISAQSAQNPALRKRLLALLGSSPACRDRLLLVEMTETAEITDMDEVARTAEALRGLNIPFCLDDFGAGAADMRLLRALEVDIVKLDGYYVSGITKGAQQRAFVAAMAEMARASGATVLGERVETEAEAAILAELGVRYGQGWLFGRPEKLPPRALTPTTARRKGATESWG